MSDFTQAKYTDRDIISELTLESKSYWGYSDSFMEECRPHLMMTKEYIDNWPVRVIKKSGSIIGYFSLKNVNGENRLDNLWIKPEFIKKGHGKSLFKESIRVAKKELGWTYFRLAGEEKAIKFYEKQGAYLIGKIPSKLGRDISLPHMEYDLTK